MLKNITSVWNKLFGDSGKKKSKERTPKKNLSIKEPPKNLLPNSFKPLTKPKFTLEIDGLDHYSTITTEALRKFSKEEKEQINKAISKDMWALQSDWQKVQGDWEKVLGDYINSWDNRPLTPEWFAINPDFLLVEVRYDRMSSQVSAASARTKGGRTWIHRSKVYTIPLDFPQDIMDEPFAPVAMSSTRGIPGLKFTIDQGLQAMAIMNRFNLTFLPPEMSYSKDQKIEARQLTSYYITDRRDPCKVSDYPYMGNLFIVSKEKDEEGQAKMAFEAKNHDYPLKSFEEFRERVGELIMAKIDLENARVDWAESKDGGGLKPGDLVELKSPPKEAYYDSVSHVGHSTQFGVGPQNTFLEKMAQDASTGQHFTGEGASPIEDRLFLYLGTITTMTKWGYPVKVQRWLKGEKIYYFNATPLIYTIIRSAENKSAESKQRP
jgi:hypothetical protein